VHVADFDIFGFAGLYAHWTDKETGEILHTFSIITTDANPLMARIHNVKKRMPVIIPKEAWKDWLAPDLSKEQMTAMLQPCPDTNMKAHSISKLITNRGAETNVPQIKELYTYPELTSDEQGSLFNAHG
jgi:putative SOS response-associated peptidase YedK